MSWILLLGPPSSYRFFIEIINGKITVNNKITHHTELIFFNLRTVSVVVIVALSESSWV
jgi:hypothetical protein